MLPGISMITPSERLIRVGVPQPSFAIGPMRNMSCSGGKKARRSLMIRGALATMSCGNMIDVDRAGPDARAQRARGRMLRLRPSRPPTPTQGEAEAELDARG